MYSIFTHREDYNYLAQYQDCFSSIDFENLLSVEYYPDADHIITQPQVQKRVVLDITNWLTKITR